MVNCDIELYEIEAKGWQKVLLSVFTWRHGRHIGVPKQYDNNNSIEFIFKMKVSVSKQSNDITYNKWKKLK